MVCGSWADGGGLSVIEKKVWGGKLHGIRRDNRMFLFYDSMFAGGANVAGNDRVMHGCAW